MVLAEDCWHRSLKPLMDKIRRELGDTPVYLTFDIDGIDPSDCPGTGKGWWFTIRFLLMLSATNLNS